MVHATLCGVEALQVSFFNDSLGAMIHVGVMTPWGHDPDSNFYTISYFYIFHKSGVMTPEWAILWGNDPMGSRPSISNFYFISYFSISHKSGVMMTPASSTIKKNKQKQT